MMWQYADECVLLRATNSRQTTSYYCCLTVATECEWSLASSLSLKQPIRKQKDCKFDKNINSSVKASFFQLRAVEKIKNVLSTADFEKVIHVFTSSILDHCTSF